MLAYNIALNSCDDVIYVCAFVLISESSFLEHVERLSTNNAIFSFLIYAVWSLFRISFCFRKKDN